MSTMPPRGDQLPGSVTVGAWVKPMRTRKSRSAASSMRWPTRAAKPAPFSVARAGTGWVIALSVVSRTSGPLRPCASAVSVAIRSAEISAAGPTRS